MNVQSASLALLLPRTYQLVFKQDPGGIPRNVLNGWRDVEKAVAVVAAAPSSSIPKPDIVPNNRLHSAIDPSLLGLAVASSLDTG